MEPQYPETLEAVKALNNLDYYAGLAEKWAIVDRAISTRTTGLEQISGYTDYSYLNPERPMTFENFLKRQAELATIAALR